MRAFMEKNEQTSQAMLQALQNINNNLRPNTRHERESTPGQSESNHNTTVGSNPSTNGPQFLAEGNSLGENERINNPNARELALEYASLDPKVRRSIPFTTYCEVVKNDHRGRNNRPNKDIQSKIGKLSIPNFDGSGKITAHAWLQKLETYLTLCPVTKKDAITFAILQLEGGGHMIGGIMA